MLSSLLPRSSVYSNIDRRRNDDEEQQELGESQNQARRSLDPFEQEQEPEPFLGRRQSYGSSSHASTSSRTYGSPSGNNLNEDGNARLGQPGDEREDDLFHSMHPQMNPFNTHHSQLEDDHAGQKSHHTDLEATFHKDQARTHEAAGPPTSLMYEDRPPDSAAGPWLQPKASVTTTQPFLPEASHLHHSSPDPSIATSPPAGTSYSDNSLSASQQTPWWLRESRKHTSPEKVKMSIPTGSVLGRKDASRNRLSQPSKTVYQAPDAGRYEPSASIYPSGPLPSAAPLGRTGPIHLQTRLSKRERALWIWLNVEDLDSFLQDVYTFYVKKGLSSIALSSFLDLLTVGFVIAFSVFLLGCVDYSVIRASHSFGEVVVPQCVSRFHGSTLLLVIAFSVFYALYILQFGQEIRKLLNMRDFYTELLDIPEADIPTVSWPVIAGKLAVLRANHPAQAVVNHADGSAALNPSDRLDAHDIANRIMRKDNYLIALFNKRVLNLAVPIPMRFANSGSFAYIADKLGVPTTTLNNAHRASSKQAALTRSLEYNLSLCLLGFLFGPDGQVRPAFMADSNKDELIAALQRRFILLGAVNAIFAPFIVLYLVFYSFFRYFAEYHKNPSSIGSRTYTQLARWKFREFNELPHIFQQRLFRSYPLADAYINQFPNDRNAQIARFVAFVAGSFTAVLVLFSLIDPDAFLQFEITEGRTVLFYITIFGTILAVSRGMVPEDHRVVDPEQLMRAVIEETHYLPAEWRGRLHSASVHAEFGQLFTLRINTFLQELLSALTTPLILCFTLPRCAPAIIDFFREFTIHVDGLGHVCSFAVFNFERHGDVRFGAPVQGKNELVSSQGKLEKSVLNFKAAHPTWQPQDETTSLYLSRMVEEPAVSARSSAAGTRRSIRSRSGKGSRRSNPSVLASPIREDEDDEESASNPTGNAAAGGGRLKSPTLANEAGLGGESYVSSMRHVADAHPAEAGDEYISGDFKPSMMDLLREGTQKRW